MKAILFAVVALLMVPAAYGQVITTIAGNGTPGYSGDGTAATLSEMRNPQGIAIDGAGNVFIADVTNNCIRRIDPTGIISTYAGNATAGYSGDGLAATTAMLHTPRCVAVDTRGNLYIADQVNNRVRKVDATGIITTYAGTGIPGFSGDGGPATAAEIFNPYGITSDDTGNIYFADFGNERIRKVDTFGIITTVAGGGTSYADSAVADSAKILYPAFVAVDGSGNIYFSDHFRNVIRKVSPLGIISRVAGDTVMGYSGDGGGADSAELNMPYGVAVDNSGNLYIADAYNNRIRKVDATGLITTIAGTGVGGYSGDGGLPAFAELNSPTGLATDAAGNLYIGDNSNQRVRYIAANDNNPPLFVNHAYQSFIICENTTTSIDSLLAINDPDAGQTDIWSVLYGALHGTVIAADTTVATGGILVPAIATYTPTTGYAGMDTFTVQVTDGGAITTTKMIVTIIATPVAGSITGASHMCPGDSVLLTDAVSGGVWTAANTHASVSAHGEVRGLTAGIDTIYYAVGNVCDTAIATFAVTVYSVAHCDSINAVPVIHGTDEDINVYPNPSDGIIAFDMPCNGGNAPDITIYDLAGREASINSAVNYNTEHVSFSTAGIAPGIYLIKIAVCDKVYRKKIIIQ